LKIGIPCEKPELEANVGTRLGTSQYLMVIDMGTMAVEAVPNPGGSGQGAGGMQAVATEELLVELHFLGREILDVFHLLVGKTVD